MFAEWRSGVAGHLILSDEDLTSVVQGNWKRLNTLQHYKVHMILTELHCPSEAKSSNYTNCEAKTNGSKVTLLSSQKCSDPAHMYQSVQIELGPIHTSH